jgi:hypothetical protein
MKLSDYTNSLTKFSVEWYDAAYSEAWEAAYEHACELVGPNSYEFNEVCLDLCEKYEDQLIV